MTTQNERMPTPAQLMEAEEYALVKQERCDNFLERNAVEAEQAQAQAVPAAEQGGDIQRVIEDSVHDVRTYADKPLSDEEIRAQAVTQPEQIHPNPKDGSHC